MSDQESSLNENISDEKNSIEFETDSNESGFDQETSSNENISDEKKSSEINLNQDLEQLDPETHQFMSKIAQCAKQIVVDPHVHLMDILFIFDQYAIAPDIIILALFKIFNEILPSYSLIKGNSKEGKYEQDLLMVYERYLAILVRRTEKNENENHNIKKMKLSNQPEKIDPEPLNDLKLACISKLLFSFPELSHNQKLISHLISNNFNFSHNLKSTDLNLIYKIITGFNNTQLQNISRESMQWLISIDIHNFLLVEDKFLTGYFYEKEKLKSTTSKASKVQKEKTDKKDFVKMGKLDKKEEKMRKKLESQRLEEEGKISEEEKKKIELKICNGILKLFLLIMKQAQEEKNNKKKKSTENCDHLIDLVFIGLRKLTPIVKDDLLSGIKIMILDIITDSKDSSIRFHGILAILTLFEKKNIDLKGIREIALSVINQIILELVESSNKSEYNSHDDSNFSKLLCKAVKSLLLGSRLPLQETQLFLNQLMLLCSLTHSSILSRLIGEIKEFYEIEENCEFIESVYRKMYYYN